MAKYSILIVDDEPVIRQGLEVLINDCPTSFTVVEKAANGNRALELMDGRHFDLVITDIEMPDLDGLEFIRICKEREYPSHFIILSGFHKFDYAQKACRFGVEDYLLKPVNTKDLCLVLQKVEHLLAKDRSVQNLWDQFLLNSSDDDLRQKLQRKYPQIRGWYYILIQFKISVNPNLLPIDLITLSEPDPTKIGVLINQGLEDEFSLNDHLFQLNQTIIDKGFHAVIFVGERVVRFNDILKSKQSAWELLPNLFYRNWNSIVYAGEGVQFSKDETFLSESLNEMKESCLQGNDLDGEIDSLYQNLLKQRLKPRLCRLRLQQFLFGLLPFFEEWGIPKEGILERYQPLFSSGYEITLKNQILMLKDFLKYFHEELIFFRKKGTSALIQEITGSIHKNYVLELNLQDFSEKYRMNKAYLGQLFKKQVGMTFNQYLNKVRIDEASNLLEQTDLKIYQIAYNVGFRDPSYFVNRFEKNTGYTPLGFRRMKVNK